MMIWPMVLALSCAGQEVDVPGLIRQLDHDDPDVREQAVGALRKTGARAFPEVEKALDHPSAEVRGRAAAVLESSPRYALRFLLNHPDVAMLQRLWNGIMETAVAKRPLPLALAAEVYEAGQEEADDLPTPGPHDGAWIFLHLRATGRMAFDALADHYGVEGEMARAGMRRLGCSCTLKPLPGDLAARLLKCGVDATAFEEIYGTILILYGGHQADGLAGLSDEDWDVVLRFWVRLRRRPGEKPMVLPTGREEALAVISRGPWVRGIADALTRTLPDSEPSRGCRFEKASLCRWTSAEQPPETREAAAIYERLLRADQMIKDRYFYGEYLRPAKPGLPDPQKWRKVHRDNLELAIGKVDVDDDTLRVLDAIVLSWDPEGSGMETKFLNENFDDVTIGLIRALANRVVEDVRGSK